MEEKVDAAVASGESGVTLDSRAWKFGGDSDEEEGPEGSGGFIDIGKRERKAAQPANVAPAPAQQRAAAPPPSIEASLQQRPLQTCPPYKDLVLLGLADPSLGGAATTSQKLMAVVKRLFPALDFKKKLYAAALAKAVENGALKKTNDGPKWGGQKYLLTPNEGQAELVRAQETESRRRSREEVDPNRAPVDATDTPFEGWTMRTYFMADGGEVKYYLPPRLAAAPPPPAAAASGGEAAGEDSDGSSETESAADEEGEEGEGGWEVEKVVDKRVTEDGVTEYKVRWKNFTAEDDTWVRQLPATPSPVSLPLHRLFSQRAANANDELC